jgi:hypothetical protein
VTDDECTLAVEAWRSAWQYTPMADVQVRQFRRLFIGYPVETVRTVLDDLIHRGVSRPGPAEMGEMLRTKLLAKSTEGTGFVSQVPPDDDKDLPEPEDRARMLADARAGLKR